ncbi:glycosyltransferase family 2 protein [Lactobacillus agilis]|uniref:glycosyltransferase family 2 protein n=1 Tax=Ligilactobacillus agilis TaxID=1601 RepID=UPI0014302CC9|nr:glycosyltransferase family 2 protein [Ligilactobacillus agilis]NJE31530.1 glycosyltransferase family 2 protein [Ligilactobacillus agilis]
MDLSVIVPVYHGRKYITNLLTMLNRNIVNAEEYSIEVILVNDSPDESIDDLVTIQDNNIHVINNTTNLGIQGARIRGIQEARGEYILMLDQDDKITENTIQTQLSKIGDADAILANGYSEDSDNNKIPLYKNEKQKNLANNFKYYLYYGNMVASPGVVIIKKNKIPKIWLDNILENNGADDWLLWAAYIKEGCNFALNSDYVYTHKNVETNFSNDEDRMLTSSMEALEILRKYITNKEYIIHKRRLDMRRRILNKPSSKWLEYLKNIDVAIYLCFYKII